MSSVVARNIDRVEEFTAAVDVYEPRRLTRHEDAFRVFARLVSRSIDARYLDRHPPQELLPDLEHLMSSGVVRQPDEIKASINVLEGSGGQRGVLTACLPDHLFVLSTVLLTLDHLGVRRFRYLTNTVPVRRDSTGEIEAIGKPDATAEAFLWIEIEAQDLDQRQDQLEEELRSRLEASQAAVADFVPITTMVGALAERLQNLADTYPDQHAAHDGNARFLRWMLDENFVFLGTRYLQSDGTTPADKVSNLGVGRFDDWRGIQIEDAERAVHETCGIPPFLWIRKSRTESCIYRAGPLDHVLVQCWDDAGRPAGLLVIEGLFSFLALAKPRTDIPLLDRLIAQLFTELQASKGTHRYRSIRNAFNSLPMEYLFTLQTDDVRQLIEQFLDVDADHRSQVHITTEELQNFAFVFVAVPRSYYTEELRIDVRRLLKARFRASSVDDGVYAGDLSSVTFHYFLTGATALESKEETHLRTEIDDLVRPWGDRLFDELARRHDSRASRRLHTLYIEAFPTRYREETSVARAVTDIELLENIELSGQFDCDLYRETADKRLGITRLRLLQTENMLLSDILPVLDNLGLVIIDEFPTTVQVPGQGERVIATFRIRGAQGIDIDLLTRRNRLRAAIRAIVATAMDSQPLNRLLLRADIPWTYVSLLRAYHNYALQIGSPYTLGRVKDTLEENAGIVRGLVELFRAKFDPGIEGQSAYEVDEQRRDLVERARRALLTLLDDVNDLTSDQVLRTFHGLVEATVRTNFFARDPMRSPQVVLKFDPSRIPRMPMPLPYREIYVHHPRISGLHLRGGAIARGGIRWSDRRLDFRTEVLGLMATQNFKNVVIVPRGAKGGFVLRRPPTEASQRRAAADAMYRVFIEGLLSVTDNLVNGKIVHPGGVLRYEGPDHYLVVAADKGTAHLSDTANQVAEAQGFWLGDAFASGGSKGYDHKKEAITARGAWECVKRHFREMGIDPEKDKIRVCGIGDMSGDVFGNGMLLSRSMQLIAAFDHRHIFIDPDPDPATSYQARRKLFDSPGSSWQDYPEGALSAGGGVFSRNAKSIKLSAEVQRVLDITESTLSGHDFIRAILRMPIDLLWNGGIGTYVKATAENNLDVGDTTNDLVRVDATEIRAKVVGEGGNLGITPIGRVELAQQGVRLNNDAVDNSAGVDLSDHEVNLKILLERPLRRKAITAERRNALLDAIGEEVNAQALANNWLQSRMISLDEIRSRRDLARFRRTIEFLSDRVPFKRREMHLPGERALGERLQSGGGLFRPELAILAANAKLDMSQELVKSESFGRERLASCLLGYFPASITEQFADDIRDHPLGTDIARTVMINRILGDAGASWLAETTLRTGCATADILEAYLQASTLLGASALKDQISALESILDADIEYQIRLAVEDAIETVTHWQLLWRLQVNDRFVKIFRDTLICLPNTMSEGDADAFGTTSTALRMANVPEELADTIATLEHVDEALDITMLAFSKDVDVKRACAAIYTTGYHSGLLSLIRSATEGDGSQDLERPARVALRDQLRRLLAVIAADLNGLEANFNSLSEPSLTWFAALRQDLAPLSNGKGELSGLVIAVDRAERHATLRPLGAG